MNIGKNLQYWEEVILEIILQNIQKEVLTSPTTQNQFLLIDPQKSDHILYGVITLDVLINIKNKSKYLIYLAGDSFTWGYAPLEKKFGTL